MHEGSPGKECRLFARGFCKINRRQVGVKVRPPRTVCRGAFAEIKGTAKKPSKARALVRNVLQGLRASRCAFTLNCLRENTVRSSRNSASSSGTNPTHTVTAEQTYVARARCEFQRPKINFRGKRSRADMLLLRGLGFSAYRCPLIREMGSDVLRKPIYAGYRVPSVESRFVGGARRLIFPPPFDSTVVHRSLSKEKMNPRRGDDSRRFSCDSRAYGNHERY